MACLSACDEVLRKGSEDLGQKLEFSGTRYELARPCSERQNLIVVATATVRKAEKLIESCENCNPVGADIPFDWILDRVTYLDAKVTDYILEVPAASADARSSKKLWSNLTGEYQFPHDRAERCARNGGTGTSMHKSDYRKALDAARSDFERLKIADVQIAWGRLQFCSCLFCWPARRPLNWSCV